MLFWVGQKWEDDEKWLFDQKMLLPKIFILVSILKLSKMKKQVSRCVCACVCVFFNISIAFCKDFNETAM